jgi:hypothetical protein
MVKGWIPDECNYIVGWILEILGIYFDPQQMKYIAGPYPRKS